MVRWEPEQVPANARKSYVSKCCRKAVDVAGHTTRYWVCQGCGQPCDAMHWFAAELSDASAAPGDVTERA